MPQSQSSVNDSFKVISVHYELPGERETEMRDRGTDLKIGSNTERVQIRKAETKSFREFCGVKKC